MSIHFGGDEKKRLQHILEWNHHDPSPKYQTKNDVAKEAQLIEKKPTRGTIEEQEALLCTLAKQIEERERFMKHMQRIGEGDTYRMQIQKEIQHKTKQMKVLHNHILRQKRKLPAKSNTTTYNSTFQVQSSMYSNQISQKIKQLLGHDLSKHPTQKNQSKRPQHLNQNKQISRANITHHAHKKEHVNKIG
jgi:hypothetical protein